MLKLHMSMKANPYCFSWGTLNYIMHKTLHILADWCSLVEQITIKCLCPWPVKFLNADFFNLMSLCKIGFIISFQQNIKHLGKLIPKLAKSSSNGKHPLLTCMPQVPRVLGGLMLIPIFATHFFYKPDSCIMFYFILLKHGPSPCDLLGKLRKCGLEGLGRFLSDLLHEPSPCVLPSGQGTLVAPQAHGGGLVSKIFTSKELSCSG